MAVNDLIFTKNAINRWQSRFNSSGSPVTVQLVREKDSALVIYANLPGMPQVPICNSGITSGNLIFEVDVPEGMEITIESNSNVVQAKVMG